QFASREFLMFLQLSVRRLSFCRGPATLRVRMVAAILLSFASVSLAAVAQKAPSAQPANDPDAQAMWVDHIEPILSKNCFRCHGAEKQKGGLDLRVTQSILAGGTDGSVVTPG